MIQLDILSGKKAGTSIVARRFPFQVGRSSDSALLLDDGGVWDHHLTFSSHRGSAVVLNVQQDALATVNGAPASLDEAIAYFDTIGAMSWLLRSAQRLLLRQDKNK